MLSLRAFLALGLIFTLLAACGGEDAGDDGGSALTATPSGEGSTATSAIGGTSTLETAPTSEPPAEMTATEPSPGPSPTVPKASETVQYEHVASWGEPVIPQMPVDVHVAADGSLYIADNGRQEVQVFDPDGELVARWIPPVADAGTESERTAIPILITGDQSGNVYTFDAVVGRLSKFDTQGTTLAEHRFDDAERRMCDLTVAPDGNIYVVAGYRCDATMPLPPTGVYVFDDDLNQLAFWESPEEVMPAAITFDAAGMAHLLVGSWGDGETLQSPRIVTIDPANYQPANWTDNAVTVEPAADFDGILAGPEDRLFLIHENDGGHPVEPATTFYEIDEAGALITLWEIEDQHHGVFQSAPGVAIGSDGLIHLADPSNAQVMRFSLDGEPHESFSAIEPGGFGFPFGVTVGPEGNVYVADDSLERVQIFEPDGTYVEERHYAVGLQGFLPHRNDLAVASDGTIHYVSPFAPLRWWLVLSPEGEESVTEIDKIFGDPREGPQFSFNPASIALTPDGTVHLAMDQQPWVRSYTPDGEFIEQWPGDDASGETMDIATGPDGVYAVIWTFRLEAERGDTANIVPVGGDPVDDAIATFSRDAISEEIQEGLITQLAVDGDGAFYLLDQLSGDIIVLTPDGTLLSRWSALVGDAEPFNLRDIAVDDEGRVFVVDGTQRQVHVFAPAD